MNIIQASDYSQWEAVAIQVGVAAETDFNKERADRRYVTIKYSEWKKVRNFRKGGAIEYVLSGTPVKEAFFAGDTNGLSTRAIDLLLTCAETQPEIGKPVELDMDKVRELQNEELAGKLVRCGLKTAQYKFREGLKVRNDVNGKPILTKQGDKIVTDTITVVCQVARIEELDGETRTVYENGYHPNEVGEREERRFWREKYEGTVENQQKDEQSSNQDPNKPPF